MTELSPLAASVRPEDMDVLARTIWGEARGEAPEGRTAVAWVIRNRAALAAERMARKATPHPLFGDGSLAGACKARWQFSCWNANDPNRGPMLAVGFADAAFADAFAVACRVLHAAVPDPTGGATHYHNHRIEPHWTRGARPTAMIGRHVFYTDVP
ncbi:cell wall hydrolase [Futiania mangrovi]|uniref:Cell wall hydrolase n=1 Tax=Futiania mangrovi TaxID=2959716 RepID=A0A9J6PD27_9PROT|nr:cell wall hydrolase [Futiania mangrovii]MCP1337269.1 cell wall hydrolase [Futiania mangrovii]